MNALHAPGSPASREILRDAIAHASHLLPSQAPLGRFVHHNTLHAFEHLPFHEALEEARLQLGCRTYPPLPALREGYRNGRVDPVDLAWALQRRGPPAPLPSPVPELVQVVLHHHLAPDAPASLRWRLQEGPGHFRLHPDLDEPRRREVVDQSTTWLAGLLDRLHEDLTLSDLVRALGGPVSIFDAPEPRAVSMPLTDMLRRLGFSRSQRVAYLARTGAELPGSGTQQGMEACRQLVDLLRDHARLPAHLPTLRRWMQRDPEGVTARLYLGMVSAAGATPERLALRAADHRPQTLREAVRGACGVDIWADTLPWLVRLVASHLDEGMAAWCGLPREEGLWSSFRAMVSAPGPTFGWLPHPASLDPDPERQVLGLLGNLLPESAWAGLVEATLLELPGWAGLVHRLQTQPTDRDPGAPPVALMDFLAIRLSLDLGAAMAALPRHARNAGHLGTLMVTARDRNPGQAGYEPATSLEATAHALALAGCSLPDVALRGPAWVRDVHSWIDQVDPTRLQQIWLEAWEHHYERHLLGALVARSKAQSRPAARPRFSLVCCIDDREESLRRAFEEQDPAHESWGAAGFFGIAMDFTSHDRPGQAQPLCPPVLTPQHAVLEHPLAAAMPEAERSRLRQAWLARASRTTREASHGWWGVLAMPVVSPMLSLPVLLRIAEPRTHAAASRALRRWWTPAPPTRLLTHRPQEAEEVLDPGARMLGFSLEERAERVERLLGQMGMRHVAPLVVLLGHGAHTSNNPHAAAYQCGACGGRRGGPNARAFAAMANDPEVRALLASRGIAIPDDTWFVGGEHDTCTEALTWYDTDLVPAALAAEFEVLTSRLAAACRANAMERCRKFMSAPANLTPERALHHVEGRAEDLGQARPELGHMTNASCVVGRRALTRGVFLDRRAFLVSYDPTTDDEEGTVLASLLAAVVPVCAGINLEYYFSAVDQDRLGAGTKLPHNLTALLGVMDGALSDLRTGLPRQMVEAHEPMRLLLVLDTTRAVMDRLFAARPELAALPLREWVRTVVMEPGEGGAWALQPDGTWQAMPPESLPAPPVREDSPSWYRGRGHGGLPPALLLRPDHHAVRQEG